jgi:hypothetical protein
MRWLFAIGALCLAVVFALRADWSGWPMYAVIAWVAVWCYFGSKGFKGA